MKLRNILIFSSMTAVGSLVHAAQYCAYVHYQEAPQLVAESRAKDTATYRGLTNLKRSRPEIARYFSAFRDETLMILRALDQPIYAGRLRDLVDSLQKSRGNISIDEALTHLLGDKMPAKEVQKRIAAFMSGKGTLRRALGEMSAEENLQYTIGKGIREIGPDSLLGRYLKEAAQIKKGKIAQEIRSFNMGPGKKTRGEERLVIAVDKETADIYAKYFLQDQSLVHFHEERQGTLNMTFNGMQYNWYGKGGKVQFEKPYEGAQPTLLPSILLSTSEAQRAQLFMNLLAKNYDLARHPWKLAKANEDGSVKDVEKFCAIGGYNSCTHWFGNIPLGDEMVREYMLPGKVDDYADISLFPDKPELDKKPRVQKLNDYDAIYSRNTQHVQKPNGEGWIPVDNPTVVPLPAAMKRLVNLVWKGNMGSMQLWEVLGLRRQQEEGELANPGYVMYAELAGMSSSRVPVVFVYQKDATDPILKKLTSTIDAH